MAKKPKTPKKPSTKGFASKVDDVAKMTGKQLYKLERGRQKVASKKAGRISDTIKTLGAQAAAAATEMNRQQEKTARQVSADRAAVAKALGDWNAIITNSGGEAGQAGKDAVTNYNSASGVGDRS